MKHVIHIFKKDVRHLWPVTLSVLVLTGLFWHSSRHPWEQVARPEYISMGPINLLVPILVLAWFFLIARLVHSEAIPGQRQFWLTRPYRRGSLLAAKTLLVVLSINLPMLIAQTVILASDGLSIRANIPGLLWEQVLLTGILILPAVAMAAMTSTMPQFIGWSLLPCAASAFANQRLQAPLQWLPTSLGVAVVLLVTVAIVMAQFLYRKTQTSRILATCGALLVWVLSAGTLAPSGIAVNRESAWTMSFAFPNVVWKPLLGFQTWLDKGPENSSRLELDPSLPISFPISQQGLGGILVPLRVIGAPEGALVSCEAANLSVIDDATGSAWNSPVMSESSNIENRPRACTVSVAVPAVNAKRFSGRPVRVHVDLYYALLADLRATSVPLDRRPVPVPGLGMCAAQSTNKQQETDYVFRPAIAQLPNVPAAIWCRAAFRWSPRFIAISGSAIRGTVFTASPSYSPFPANLSFDPVETRWTWAQPEENGNIAVRVAETTQFVHSSLDVRSVVLPESAPGAPR